MKPRRKPWRTAVVHWDDAYRAARNEGAPGAMQVSSGIVLENSKRCVKLAQIVCPWGTFDERDVLTIPRELVRNVQIVRHDWRP